ncbi:MAG: YkgJ family cysteine cluster protein [Clostridia bacterium]|nr:YkgJ family cysteine cluster protein [Clostridia bacterium]
MKIITSKTYAIEHGQMDQLETLYGKVPSGTCAGCTRCCSESVNMSYVEFLNVHNHFVGDGSLMKHPDFVNRLIRYYLLELVQPMKCPFLNENNLCDVYAFRPLPCRIFGNTTKAAYESNYKGIRIQNMEVARQLLHESDLKMPKSVLHKEIGFCEDYVVNERLDSASVQKMYDQLVNMDGGLVFKGLLKPTQFNQNLVGWFIEALLDEIDPKVLSRVMLSELRLEALKAANLG